jgi:bifunctional non-homologous end joining protein LigD
VPQIIHRTRPAPRQRRRDGDALDVEIGGRPLRLTNLDKVLWPANGFTKSQLIDFYVRIAPVLLPHIANRPMTLARFPDGVDVDGWYQTNCWHHPEWMPTAHVVLPHGKPEGRDYCVFNDVASLVWAANMGTVELHPLLANVDDLDTPLVAVFDLDPGAPAGLVECARVAVALRETLAGASLDSYAKVSGAKGIQVYVPLNTPTTYMQTKAFARAVAGVLADQYPDLVIAEMARAQRAGKVFVDWSQNDRNKSTIAPYSLRSATLPTVSAPLRWDDIEEAAREHDAHRLVVTSDRMFERLDTDGDLFEPVLAQRQVLPT